METGPLLECEHVQEGVRQFVFDHGLCHCKSPGCNHYTRWADIATLCPIERFFDVFTPTNTVHILEQV